MPSIVEVRELTRRFADAIAVDRLSFAVRQGEVFGLLGPNGAGKTTTVRMLTGYLPPTEGTVVVAGHDLRREPNEARQHLAVVPEEANTYVDLIRVGFGEAHYFPLWLDAAALLGFTAAFLTAALHWHLRSRQKRQHSHLLQQ